jgi:hypothetical protein
MIKNSKKRVTAEYKIGAKVVIYYHTWQRAQEFSKQLARAHIYFSAALKCALQLYFTRQEMPHVKSIKNHF